MNPPSAVLGGGVHGKVCWLIAYMSTVNKECVLVDCLDNYVSDKMQDIIG